MVLTDKYVHTYMHAILYPPCLQTSTVSAKNNTPRPGGARTCCHRAGSLQQPLGSRTQWQCDRQMSPWGVYITAHDDGWLYMVCKKDGIARNSTAGASLRGLQRMQSAGQQVSQ